LLSATSNEADNGLGDGDFPNDIQGFDVGSADTSGQLRAERSGRGNGRVYTLTYRGLDLAGNTHDCKAVVTVPK
jgi:endo-1,4-beta-xylanase